MERLIRVLGAMTRWGLGICALLAVLVALYVSLGRQLVPLVAEYRAEVEDKAEQALGMPVHIGSLEGHWGGLAPVLVVKDIQVGEGATALRLDGVKVVPDLWASLSERQLRLANLEVGGLHLSLHEDEQGAWTLDGLPKTDDKPLDPQQLFATLQRLGLRSAPLREPVASSAAATEARPDQDIWQVLRQAGVDVDGGIARAMQKPDIYRKWLLMFARNSADFRTQTDTALAAGDDALLLRLVHTVKGAAANVSAEAVVQQAEALEAVLHAPQDSGQRAAALIALQRELDAVQQAVAALERA